MAGLCRASLWEVRDPRVASGTDSRLHAGVQTTGDVEWLLPGDAARGCRAGHRRYRSCGTAGHRHRRRCAARDGHHRAGHRIRHPRVLPADGADRPGRDLRQRRLARRSPGLPNGRAVGLPQLLHDARAAQSGGKPHAHGRGRIAGRPHRGLDRRLAPPRIRHRGADSVGDRAFQCEAACRDAGHRVDHRLQQLVPEQRRCARGVAPHAGRTPRDAGKPRPRPVRPAPAHDAEQRKTRYRRFRISGPRHYTCDGDVGYPPRQGQ